MYHQNDTCWRWLLHLHHLILMQISNFECLFYRSHTIWNKRIWISEANSNYSQYPSSHLHFLQFQCSMHFRICERWTLNSDWTPEQWDVKSIWTNFVCEEKTNILITITCVDATVYWTRHWTGIDGCRLCRSVATASHSWNINRRGKSLWFYSWVAASYQTFAQMQ